MSNPPAAPTPVLPDYDLDESHHRRTPTPEPSTPHPEASSSGAAAPTTPPYPGPGSREYALRYNRDLRPYPVPGRNTGARGGNTHVAPAANDSSARGSGSPSISQAPVSGNPWSDYRRSERPAGHRDTPVIRVGINNEPAVIFHSARSSGVYHNRYCHLLDSDDGPSGIWLNPCRDCIRQWSGNQAYQLISVSLRCLGRNRENQPGVYHHYTCNHALSMRASTAELRPCANCMWAYSSPGAEVGAPDIAPEQIAPSVDDRLPRRNRVRKRPSGR